MKTENILDTEICFIHDSKSSKNITIRIIQETSEFSCIPGILRLKLNNSSEIIIKITDHNIILNNYDLMSDQYCFSSLLAVDDNERMLSVIEESIFWKLKK